jgi:hypothetical protein
MRDCKRVWIELLILFLCLVITAHSRRAEAQRKCQSKHMVDRLNSQPA